MKTTTIVGLMMMFSTFQVYAADNHQPMQVNFDQMIEDNTRDAQGLTQDLAKNYKNNQASAQKAKKLNIEKVKVTDFVDFEVQAADSQNTIARQKPTSDRRYN